MKKASQAIGKVPDDFAYRVVGRRDVVAPVEVVHGPFRNHFLNPKFRDAASSEFVLLELGMFGKYQGFEPVPFKDAGYPTSPYMPFRNFGDPQVVPQILMVVVCHCFCPSY